MQSTVLTPVTAANRRALEHFFVAYLYELAQYDDGFVINNAGLPTWAALPAPGPQTWEECVSANWWMREECEHYLAYVDGRPAGFAIVCAQPHILPSGVQATLMDFYITPRYRQQGVGRDFARSVFARHLGEWTLFVLPRNERARRFWRRVLGELTDGRFSELGDATRYRFTCL